MRQQYNNDSLYSIYIVLIIVVHLESFQEYAQLCIGHISAPHHFMEGSGASLDLCFSPMDSKEHSWDSFERKTYFPQFPFLKSQRVFTKLDMITYTQSQGV